MKERLVLLAITALVLAPWGEVSWVWDDGLLIGMNPDLSWGRLASMWGEDLWAGIPGEHSHTFYRPLMVATLVFDQGLLAGSPVAARLHSLAWHLLAVGLLHRLLKDRPGVLLACALYALHPVMTEAVHFVAARNDNMAVVAVLAVLICFEDRQLPTWRRALGGAVLFAGLLSKESAVVALLALAVRDAELFRELRFRRYVELAVGAFAALLLRSAADLDPPALSGDAFTALVVLGEWGTALWFPTGAAPALAPSELDVNWLGVFGLVAVITLSIRSRVGAAIAVGGLGLGVVGAVLSDGLGWRYLALPLAGVAISVAHFDPRKPLLGWVAVAALGGLSLLTKPMWTDNSSFWLTNHAARPGPSTACGAFKALELSGDLEGAAELLPEALPRPHCCYNASRFHLERQDPAQAISFGEHALDVGCPASPELTAPIGLASALTGDWDRAKHYASLHQARDPYGYSKVVLTAEGLRRDDRSALEQFGGSPELEARARRLLE